MNEKNDRWIGIDEAADYLGVTSDSIRKWIKANTEIPSYRIGKKWKFKKTELDDWVKNGKASRIKN